jgi:lipopolysaccharide/colanic/teichoic acid biosynthesis glycosyltransferase
MSPAGTTRLRIRGASRGLSLLERLISRNRYVCGIALMLTLGLPALLQPLVAHLGVWFAPVALGGFQPPLAMVALAVIAGHASLARLGLLPLVTARSLILPTFVITFGGSALLFQTLQMPIGRYHIWTGLLITLGWYFLIATLRGRYLRQRVALIGLPADFADGLPGSVEWTILKRPRFPSRVSAVVIDPHADLDLAWSRFVTSLVLRGVPVYHRHHFEEALTGRVRFSSHADNDFGALLPSLAYQKVKRLLDLALCAILAVPFLLVILLAALAIRLESPGSPFFLQVRRGYRGAPFVCFKLRTMRHDRAGPSFTLEDDPRITRLGRLLRKWRIDELPQILNVLRGEMSWIGPRPEALDLARRYAANVPFYDYRHAVRPGITGWAAVHQGNVDDLDAARVKLEYDFYYIRHFSPSLDFLIVLKTLSTVVSGFGSR